MTRAERASVAVTAVFCAALAAFGASVLLGLVSVAGWGAGTLAVRLIFGGIFALLGSGGLVEAVKALVDGQPVVQPPAPPVDPSDPITDPFHVFGFGEYGPGGGSQQHANGEF
ncbi:hypothetical protein GCM10027605_14170 [Micromonospora zhanjiangensis]